MASVYAYSGMAVTGLDDKGRLSVPAFLRKDLIASSEGRTLCLGKHEKWDCLVGFGLSRKADLLEEIEMEEKVAVARNEPYDRFVASTLKFSTFYDLSFDASGRFVLPGDLREIGMLSDKVVIHGSGKSFCMWDPTVLLESPDNIPVNHQMVKFHLKEAEKKDGGKKK